MPWHVADAAPGMGSFGGWGRISGPFASPPMTELPDPRRYAHPGAAMPEAAALHDLAARSLGVATAQESDVLDAAIASALDAMLVRGDGAALAAVLDSAPTLAFYRYLWRSLSRLANTARHARGASQ